MQFAWDSIACNLIMEIKTMWLRSQDETNICILSIIILLRPRHLILTTNANHTTDFIIARKSTWLKLTLWSDQGCISPVMMLWNDVFHDQHFIWTLQNDFCQHAALPTPRLNCYLVIIGFIPVSFALSMRKFRVLGPIFIWQRHHWPSHSPSTPSRSMTLVELS